jgi:hypothetical protein
MGSRRGGKLTPTVIDGVLYTDDENTTGIHLDTPAWFAWKIDNPGFYYRTSWGGFSVRKRRQYHADYWYAFGWDGRRRVCKYIGLNEAVTATRLAALGVL